jgi:Zn-dependent protease with chaperone function
MQTQLYPKGPSNVPSDLANPSKSFKKHIWIASGALILFMGLYLALCSWSLLKAWHLFTTAATGGRGGGASVIAALFLAFLGIFMLKALFFRNRAKNEGIVQITKEEEPQLFEFVNRVADEAKAPRPKKIFLSNRVNACVFYDLSVLNLIFPTRKNLEIGLGLVNTLDLGEFKSIIAHEFGHFAQKSMIIGRWVYVANRIAYQIVAKRDVFDNIINGISRLDLRIAWIGWILSILVWAIRSVSDTLFMIVLLTQRALSREMEFHADMVAVSLTGSDAIVNSLYKLQAADEAYENALEFVNLQLKDKKAVSDIYAIQSNYIRHMAGVLNNPEYCVSPKIPEGQESSYKVFRDQIAHPPKMWSTHPSNIDREKNAKTTYIKSEPDTRSPWLLFKDAEKTKSKLTLDLYTNQKEKPGILSTQESIALHNKDFQRSFLIPRYRGIYQNRNILIDYNDAADIYEPSFDQSQLTDKFTELYPESLQKQLTALRNLEEGVALLNGLNNKTLNAKEGKIIFRGREISRKELPVVIGATKRELNEEREKLNEHDKLCRNVHYQAAKKIGNGWDTYLASLTKLVHFCEHSERNMEALAQKFYETLAVVSQMRNLSQSDLMPLISAANDLYYSMDHVYTKAIEIKLNESVLSKMGGKRLEEYIEPFKLGKPDLNNINSWINVVDGWMGLAMRALNILHIAVLDELIASEEYVRSAYFSGGLMVQPAPAPIEIYYTYARYREDNNKNIIAKANAWSRFYYADGPMYTVVRLAVAASIIGFGIFLTTGIGNTKIVVYNGLPVDVYVNLGNKNLLVPYHASYEVELDNSSSIDIKTRTPEGKAIEAFTADMPDESQTYIYNIANAAVIYRWIAYYGMSYATNANFTAYGAKRWFQGEADHYFEDPPESISTSGGGEVRTVISAYYGYPGSVAAAIESKEEKELFLATHARYESSSSPYILAWLGLASDIKDFQAILKERLDQTPDDVMLLRMQQDFCDKKEKGKLCEKTKQHYKEHPDDPDLYYLTCRCLEGEKQKDSAFAAGYEKWKDNPWLAYAAGSTYCQMEKWDKALDCYKLVYEKAPGMKEAILEDMKRIYHMKKQDSLMVFSPDFALPYMQFIELVERSTDNTFQTTADDYTYAFKLLAQGKLKEALEYSRPDTGQYNSILRLAAVSDSASDEVIEEALKLDPMSAFGKATYIPALALAIRKSTPAEAIYKESLLEMIGESGRDSVFKFAGFVQDHKINEAEHMLKRMPPELKGKLALLGVLIGEKNVPANWKELATGLLFLNEMPYLITDTRKGKKKV